MTSKGLPVIAWQASRQWTPAMPRRKPTLPFDAEGIPPESVIDLVL